MLQTQIRSLSRLKAGQVMLKQSGNIYWRNRLLLLFLLVALANLSLAAMLFHDTDRFTLNTQTPISLSSYFQDYALITPLFVIDSRPHKTKSIIGAATRISPPENANLARFLVHSQSLFYRSLCWIPISFTDASTAYRSWLHHACKLIDLPPPPPARFTEPV
jgi:hypothetical protein